MHTAIVGSTSFSLNPVTGSEDGMVYFFDIEKGTAFNQLPAGNTVPILDVCWAYDESILASSDTEVHACMYACGYASIGLECTFYV